MDYNDRKLIKSIINNTEGMDDDTYNRLCKVIDLEEVPDEDLWQDGEIGAKEVSEIIFQRVVNIGDWKLMREPTSYSDDCYGCATQRDKCEHDNWEDTSVHISEPIKAVLKNIKEKDNE